MPVYFITADHVQGGRVNVTGALQRHLQASLRTQAGEEVWFGIPSRHRYRVRVTRADRTQLSGEILEERPRPPQACSGLELAVALLKSDKMDWTVQKATELGVTSIVPLLSQRTIVRPQAAKAAQQAERWRRIALEAAQQAERWDVPVVRLPKTIGEYSATSVPGPRLMLCERRTSAGLQAVDLPGDPALTVTLMVGPEGGWTEAEIDEALGRGWIPVSLGERILRAETAALAALAVLQSRIGNLG